MPDEPMPDVKVLLVLADECESVHMHKVARRIREVRATSSSSPPTASGLRSRKFFKKSSILAEKCDRMYSQGQTRASQRH